jgi:hypothetical protein
MQRPLVRPFLVRTEEKREVLGHEAGLDGVDAHLLQGRGELAKSGLLSSLARWARPRAQAKIDAMELVDVALPFWYSR